MNKSQITNINQINPLAVFNERDVFPDKADDINNVVFEDRPTGKIILFDHDQNIALVGNKVNNHYLLPGGGIDGNETIEAGVIRECLEETGCNAKLDKFIGVIEDYRNRDKKHCISYCYTASLIGDKGVQKLTAEESKNGVHVLWVSLAKALDILDHEEKQLKRGEINFYNTGFNILRDHIFLREANRIHD